MLSICFIYCETGAIHTSVGRFKFHLIPSLLMRLLTLIFAPIAMASYRHEMTIEEIDAMIDEDPKFWSNWDSVKKGEVDDFAVSDEIDPLPDSPTSLTTQEALSETEPVTTIQPTVLYNSLKTVYEMLAENPFVDANLIAEQMRTRTSTDNPYATAEQVEATRTVILEACVIPVWAHKALIWMVKPNPDFAIRFIDTFIRSFLSAFNSAANQPIGILQMKYSIWIRFVLVPFAKDQSINCEQVAGTETLRLKPDLLPVVFKDQLELLKTNPEQVMGIFASPPRS